MIYIYSFDCIGESPVVSSNDELPGERVSLKTWLKKPEVLGSFPCNEVMASGDHYAGYVHTYLHRCKYICLCMHVFLSR